MSLNNFLTCPADCDSPPTLPAIPADQSCTAYDQKYSQICGVYIIPEDATDILDYTVPTAPVVATSTVDNTNTDNTKAKYVVGEGGVPAPEVIVGEYPKRKTRVTDRIYTLTMRVKNTAATLNSFFDILQCGDTNFTFYFENIGGFIFGGYSGGAPGGIIPDSIDIQRPLDGGRDDKMYTDIVITWTADGDPKRYPNPYA